MVRPFLPAFGRPKKKNTLLHSPSYEGLFLPSVKRITQFRAFVQKDDQKMQGSIPGRRQLIEQRDSCTQSSLLFQEPHVDMSKTSRPHEDSSSMHCYPRIGQLTVCARELARRAHTRASPTLPPTLARRVHTTLSPNITPSTLALVPLRICQASSPRQKMSVERRERRELVNESSSKIKYCAAEDKPSWDESSTSKSQGPDSTAIPSSSSLI